MFYPFILNFLIFVKFWIIIIYYYLSKNYVIILYPEDKKSFISNVFFTYPNRVVFNILYNFDLNKKKTFREWFEKVILGIIYMLFLIFILGMSLLLLKIIWLILKNLYNNKSIKLVNIWKELSKYENIKIVIVDGIITRNPLEEKIQKGINAYGNLSNYFISIRTGMFRIQKTNKWFVDHGFKQCNDTGVGVTFSSKDIREEGYNKVSETTIGYAYGQSFEGIKFDSNVSNDLLRSDLNMYSNYSLSKYILLLHDKKIKKSILNEGKFQKVIDIKDYNLKESIDKKYGNNIEDIRINTSESSFYINERINLIREALSLKEHIQYLKNNNRENEIKRVLFENRWRISNMIMINDLERKKDFMLNGLILFFKGES